MRNILLTATLLLSALPLFSQTDTKGEAELLAPFDFPLYLSGNFGELRSNHFHGGIDFKTQGVEGKPIHCPADGYISRVSVYPGGYGNAIYITHDNGYTTVHGHLKAFTPEIAALVKEHQYAHQTFVVDTTFDTQRFVVKRGQIVGLAGNSGYSFGPHLHMEVRKTATNEPIDPLRFYKHKIKDTTPPRAKRIMIYPQKGKGMVEGRTSKISFAFGQDKTLAKPITAWGEIGVGISANDYMDGTSNNYGVHRIWLLVDSVEVFRSTMDKFSFPENRMINSWTDYEEYRSKGRWYTRSFIAPGNTLRMLQTSHSNRGIVYIDEERIYQFEYILEDLYGNRSRYRFQVQGVQQEIAPHYSQSNNVLKWDRYNIVRESGMELDIPKEMLYEDAELDVVCIAPTDSTAPSMTYHFGDVYIPLHSFCTLSIKVTNDYYVNANKYYIIQQRNNKNHSVGGNYKNGWISTGIREIGGNYYVSIDTIAPSITPIGREQWAQKRCIRVKLRDKETGIGEYRGTIDGQWVLMEFSSKNNTLTCHLTSTPIEQTGKYHDMVITVKDNAGNTTVLKQRIVY